MRCRLFLGQDYTTAVVVDLDRVPRIGETLVLPDGRGAHVRIVEVIDGLDVDLVVAATVDRP